MAKAGSKNQSQKKNSNIPFLPSTSKKGLKTVGIHHQSVSIRSSPLPSPEDLADYSKIKPGFADRIIKLAEKEAQHRHSIAKRRLSIDELKISISEKKYENEKIGVKSQSRNSISGVIFAFIITMAMIIACTYLISSGEKITGGLLMGATLVGIVSAFIYGTNQKRKK